MIRLNLCDYTDSYILVKGTIPVPNTTVAGAAVNNRNKEVIFKNCGPFTDCITEIYNTQIDDAQKSDVVMPIYNSVEYSDTYSKRSGTLWQYFRVEPAFYNIDNIIGFLDDNSNSTLFKLKQKIKGQTRNGGTKDVEIMVPLKYLSNFLENT